jgi:hypothetical protein
MTENRVPCYIKNAGHNLAGIKFQIYHQPLISKTALQAALTIGYAIGDEVRAG